MANIIGLTGGIGSGKTSVMKHIESLGYNVYYTDEVAKKIMSEKEVVILVNSIFDENVIQEDGHLNRKRIAEIVFSNPEKLKELNNIIHPKVAADFEKFVSKLDENEIVIKESAILFESKSNVNCNYVVLVTAPLEVRINRVIKRDGISRNEVLKRIQNQISEEEKVKMSDFVINNLSLKESFENISKFLKKIQIKHC